MKPKRIKKVESSDMALFLSNVLFLKKTTILYHMCTPNLFLLYFLQHRLNHHVKKDRFRAHYQGDDTSLSFFATTQGLTGLGGTSSCQKKIKNQNSNQTKNSGPPQRNPHTPTNCLVRTLNPARPIPLPPMLPTKTKLFFFYTIQF